MIYLLKMFRICSEFSVNVQNNQNLFRMFRIFSQCSEFSVMFRLCSVNVQNLFKIFSQCSEFSVMFRLCSEYLAQKLVCSEFLDFVVGCRWVQLFFIDFQLFYFLTRIIPELQLLPYPDLLLFYAC